MTIPAVRARRFPYLQRRQEGGRGGAGNAPPGPACNVVSDGDNVIADGDNVIVSKCTPFNLVVGDDNVVVENFNLIVGL